MNVLGIETSCDETAVAVVSDGRRVLANCVFSQIRSHEPFGGVVPELASRQHLEILPLLIPRALEQAGLFWQDLDAFAVTHGPGLVSALRIGVVAAQTLALRWNKPLHPVHHVEAHLYSLFLPSPDNPTSREAAPELPCLVLMVSGGHTLLLRVLDVGRYELLGQSLDDAAGEALDKGASLMGLGYPGGPAIERAALGGDPHFLKLPDVVIRPSRRTWGRLDPEFCFSFSGLKTALLYTLRQHPEFLEPGRRADVAASFQDAVFEVLVSRVERALDAVFCRSLGCVGGVARNQRLRERLAEVAAARSLPLHFAPEEYCTDNAAMVAGLAGHPAGPPAVPIASVEACPTLPLPQRGWSG